MISANARAEILTKNTNDQIENVLEGGKTRINQCHTFSWSRSLWKEGADKMRREVAIMLIVYLVLASVCCHYDGIRGVDVPYFLATTLTTIGLGDLSPSSQWFRLVSIFMLPFGIVVLTFGVAHAQALALSHERRFKPKVDVLADLDAALEFDLASKLQDNALMQSEAARNARKELARGWKIFKESIYGQTILALRNFFLTVVIGKPVPEGRSLKVTFLAQPSSPCVCAGAIFFRFFHHEQMLQKRNADTDMTWTDCFYFATVACTTVGYGHIISPQSTGAKVFCIFYFVLGTTVVGNSIRDLAGLYFRRTRDSINDKIIDSTVWVHKADLHRTGFIFQADYVLFKLRQMKAVDENVIRRLSNRFKLLDEDCQGLLTVGREVPSAEQVVELQKIVQGTKQKLADAWADYRIAHGFHKAESIGDGTVIEKPISLVNCHDFDWSRVLYREAFVGTCKTTLLCFIAYGFLCYLTMAYYDDSITGGERSWFHVEGWYFISATVSTVGLGDYAPETQLGRGFANIMIPFGIIVLSLSLSAKTEYELSKPVSQDETDKDMATARLVEGRLLFAVLDPDNKTGALSKGQVIQSASQFKKNEGEMEVLFDFLDLNKNGKIDIAEIETHAKAALRETVGFKCFALVGSVYLMIFIGALFFKMYSPEDENNLTWIDAFYLGTVIATSIGYGDIVPISDGGKLFLLFYMLMSTVLVGSGVREVVKMYVNDIVGAKIDHEIMMSTTWVHKMAVCDPLDPSRYFNLTEADFVMFKLMQMQKVDEVLMDRLIDRFIELDFESSSRSLIIGVEIPSEFQVKEMQELTSDTGMTLQQAWKKKLKGQVNFTNNPKLVKPLTESHFSISDALPSRRSSDEEAKGRSKGINGAGRSGKVHPIDDDVPAAVPSQSAWGAPAENRAGPILSSGTGTDVAEKRAKLEAARELDEDGPLFESIRLPD